MMGWPNDALLSRALTELLRMVGLADLWTPQGPTKKAYTFARKRAGGSGQRHMLAAALSIWNNQTNPAPRDAGVGVVACCLDRTNLHAVLTLAAALHDPAAVESWIADPNQRRIRIAGHHCGSGHCDGYEGWAPGESREARDSARPFCACSCADCIEARKAEPVTERVFVAGGAHA